MILSCVSFLSLSIHNGQVIQQSAFLKTFRFVQFWQAGLSHENTRKVLHIQVSQWLW